MSVPLKKLVTWLIVPTPTAAINAAAAPDWLSRPKSLRTILGLMVLALLIPSMAFSGYLVSRSSAVQRSNIEQRLVQSSGALTVDIDREIERMFSILETLAQSQSLVDQDYATFYVQAKTSVQRLGANIILVDATSHQVINTRVPYGTTLPDIADPDAVAAVRKSRTPAVSDLVTGAIAKAYVFNILVPLTSDKLHDHVLVLTLNVDQLLKILVGQQLPAGWVTGISDRHGTIIARSAKHDSFVGQRLPPAMMETRPAGAPAFSSVSMEGVQIMRATARSQLSGWLFSANVPQSLVDADILRSQATLGAGGFGLLALGLTLASFFAGWIIEPMQALMKSAVTLELNEIPAPLASPVIEANQVAAALRLASIELKERTIRLRRIESRLEQAQRTARLAYFDLDFVDQTVTVSETFEEIFGYQPTNTELGLAIQAFQSHVHPADRARTAAVRAAAFKQIGKFHDELRIVLANGEVRWIATLGETFGDAEGHAVRTILTNLDITERKQQEEHIQFLMREVSHRSKNLLAIVQAMATQTAKTSQSFHAFQAQFSQRLQAMAASHDLLINQNWVGVNLAVLVRAQLRPFAEDGNGRVEISGPGVLLKPEAAQAIGLALHELATNATKYGSLSIASGRVNINWEMLTETSDMQFRLVWRESGGPTMTTPIRKGFGHIVFERMIAQSLNAEVKLEYDSGGLVWSLNARLVDICAQPTTFDATEPGSASVA
jgi:PAS domain S-box-containing protein